MPLSDEDAVRLIARIQVLEHVVGVLVRELAVTNGMTADDVAAHAESAKKFFEERKPANELYLTAAVDRLFQQIVADIIRSQKSR